jgi:erythromycin esterase
MLRSSKIKTGPSDFTRRLQMASQPLQTAADLNGLMEEIGDARYVLLGEASHGTHEYYTWRAHISKRLISEKNFSMIAVEGDWPDCYLLNRYIKNYPDAGESASEVLRAFNRWPTWMWANWEVAALAEWLHKHNKDLAVNKKVGFYGLDVYSLWESMQAISSYLEKTDPAALKYVQRALDCFEPFNVREGFSYAERSYGLSESCQKEVTGLLADLRRRMAGYNSDHEAVFSAEQNALVAVNAERYYQVMLRGEEASWNIRDRHMGETINRLMHFHGNDAKIIIWEHNTHIGDARATDMKGSGLINVGQLVKEEHEREGVVRVGFGSYEGTVMASDEWNGEMKKMTMPPARKGSWEQLLHGAGAGNKLLLSKNIGDFEMPIGHRAIGVIYHPEYEAGNYVPSIIPERYEAFIFLEKTQALHSMHITPDGSQMPETFPWGV